MKSHRAFSKLQPDLLALLGLLLMLAVLWQPFGFKTLGLAEEWSNLTQVETNVPMLNATSLFALRPLVLLAFAIGHWLTPGSYIGLNFLQLLIFLLKGTVVYQLVRQLFKTGRVFAWLTAVLFVIFPADSELFALRSVSTHFALLLYLLSVLLFVRYWEQPQPFILVLTGVCQAISLLGYELGFALVGLTPLLLLIYQKSISKRLIRVAALWYIVPVLCAVRDLIQLAHTPNTYQSNLVSSSSGILQNVPDMLKNLIRAYKQSFWDGWIEAFNQASRSPYLPYVLLTALIVMGTALLLLRFEPPRKRRYGVCLLIGLVSLGVAFAPFLLSAMLRGSNARVFYYSSLGAALSMAAALWIITRRRVVWAIAMSGLISVAAISGFEQKQTLQEYGSIQQRLLSGIAEQAGNFNSDSVILIFDQSYTFRSTHFLYAFGDYTLEDSLRYLYERPTVHAAFCFPDSLASRGIVDECDFQANRVVISERMRPAQSYPYNKVIGLQWDNWSETLSVLPALPVATPEYDPLRLINKREVPSRAYTLLTHWPDNQPILHRPQQRIDFTFNQTVPGVGWAGAQGDNTWTSQQNAVFWCILSADRDYIVQFRASALTETMLESATLQVNGVSIPLTSQWDTYFKIFSGVIPHEAIARNSNRTELSFGIAQTASPQQLGTGADGRQLGLLLNWLHIEPVQ